jgi:beta-aspartyl-dipeptidase (metallo-type)
VERRQAIEIEGIDTAGCVVVPGLIDVHAHLIGGSGEKGPGSATPPLTAKELLDAGITTVVGTLGTDTTTKTMPALLAAVKSMRAQGLGAFAWTGGYDARPLTRSIRDDVVLVDEIIGAGELAIADKRGAHFSARELARYASDCYVAGTFTGKAGLLHLHVGPSERRLKILREVLDHFDVEPSWFYPTHVSRSEALIAEAAELSRRGMPIDIDVVEEDLPRWVRIFRDRGGDLTLLTASTDAPIGKPRALLEQVRACIREGVLSRDEAFALVTTNPARILKLKSREDYLVLDQNLELLHVVCDGRKTS